MSDEVGVAPIQSPCYPKAEDLALALFMQDYRSLPGRWLIRTVVLPLLENYGASAVRKWSQRFQGLL